MSISSDLIEELNVLSRFNLTTTQEGIKVHKDAEPAMIETVKRLYQKKLISQEDGGYLTDLGREVAEHIQSALTILTSA